MDPTPLERTGMWQNDDQNRRFRIVTIKAILPIRAKALKLLEGLQYTQYDDEKGPAKIYRGQQIPRDLTDRSLPRTSVPRTPPSSQHNTVQYTPYTPYSLFPGDSLEAESATVPSAPFSLFPRDSLETESATLHSLFPGPDIETESATFYSIFPRRGIETESATSRPTYEVGHRVAPGTSARSTSTSSATVATSRLGDPAGQTGQQPTPEGVQLSSLARAFASIELGNYTESLEFISDHPSIVAKGEFDALIAEASVAERAGQSAKARTYIHQALLLRKCNEVGRHNISSFLRNLNAEDGGTKESFVRDVEKAYTSIQHLGPRTPQQRRRPASEFRGRGLYVSSLSELSVSSRRPSYSQRTLQESRHAAAEPTSAMAAMSIDQGTGKGPTEPARRLPAAIPRNMCGSAIKVKYKQDSSDSSAEATIGGCMRIDSTYYGFTVAHVLSPSTRTGFDRVPASASLASKSWECDSDLSELSGDDEEHSPSARATTQTTKPTVKGFSWQLKSGLTGWQTVSTTSIIQDSDLDWLLIPLDSSLAPFENAVKFSQDALFPKTIHLKDVPEHLPANTDVTLVTGKSGNLRVRPSPSAGGIFLPSAGRVVKVWPFQHEPGALGPGDSGSWAIGDEGQLYGYLLGSCEQMGVSYIAPMATVMAAIRARNAKGDVSIPGQADSPHVVATSGRPRPLPTLSESRQWEPTRIRGTAGNRENLDPRYRIRQDAEKFFVLGRVFAMLRTESTGGEGVGRAATELGDPIEVSQGRFGEKLFSYICRMIVVRERHGHCFCLSIVTYNGQGVTMPGLSQRDREAHTIIHMTDIRPYCSPEEMGLITKKPIAVEPSSSDQKLDRMSRVDFNRTYMVEHNVKVMDVGRVSRESLPLLTGYWWQALDSE